MNIFGLLAAIQIIVAMNKYTNKGSLHCEFLSDFYLLKLFLELLRREDVTRIFISYRKMIKKCKGLEHGTKMVL